MASQQEALRRISGQLISYSQRVLDPVPTQADQSRTEFDARHRALFAALEDAEGIADSLRDVARCACEAFVIAKQLDAMSRQYVAAAQASVEKLRLLSPMMQQQLDRLAEQTQVLLQQASLIDARTCTREDLEYRTQLLRFARESNLGVARMLMRLMSL